MPLVQLDHYRNNCATTKQHQQQSTISECPDLYAKWYCLNGATCFSVKIQDSTLYNCWCPIGFHGLRCDYKYVERRPQQLPEENEKTYNHLAVNLTNANQVSDNEGAGIRGKHEALEARLQIKEISLVIVYNFILLLLVFLIIALLIRFLRQKAGQQTMGQTMGRSFTLQSPLTSSSEAATSTSVTTSTSSTVIVVEAEMESAKVAASMTPACRREEWHKKEKKNEQINHDSVSIGLDMIEQERKQQVRQQRKRQQQYRQR